MSIPERLRVSRPSEQAIREFSALCARIENGMHRGENMSEALAEWNARAKRVYEPIEFTTYNGAVSMEVFVEGALLPPPRWLEDITFGELAAVVEMVVAATMSEAEVSYYLNLIETNLPGANVTDLIYWPNEWFGDEALLHAELTAEQIVTYASIRSGRSLADALIGVVLPYPVPGGRAVPVAAEE